MSSLPDDHQRQPIPGEVLLQPVVIVAAVVLVVNDHWLKAAWPGSLTGKLSDITGLIVFPLLLASLAELFRLLTNRDIVRDRDAVLWPVICGAGFALVKCTGAGNDAYAWAVGLIRWPLNAATAVLQHDAVPSVHEIVVARDTTDLLSLLVLGVPYILLRARRNHLMFTNTSTVSR